MPPMVLGQPLPVETALAWGCELEIAEDDSLIPKASHLALDLSRRWPDVGATRALLRSSMPSAVGLA